MNYYRHISSNASITLFNSQYTSILLSILSTHYIYNLLNFFKLLSNDDS